MWNGGGDRPSACPALTPVVRKPHQATAQAQTPHPQEVLGWPRGDMQKHQRQRTAAKQVQQHARGGPCPQGTGLPAQFLHLFCGLRTFHKILEEKRHYYRKIVNCEEKFTVKGEQNRITK